ncbi:Fpg/Nei family DNA glycosylase [Nostocoides sp. HKS02]|uniref:Fpg/Nei family DNA glycosylase n=1 Tax=Nostocoides sp. HKS02 TaxID=1813880 RepID=UPI0012B46C52|nr:DNA-formamidopyrimidine glycosylase family protein [Tetrasphaera sp. HKS02]QGN56934.1 Fpg/Nei family DNA glycosylase [Tetrasphaera sp. HKS02]
MPEGDTVWRTAHRLDQALAGAPVVVCDLRFPAVATIDLRGATTLEVVSRGKHLLHRLDSGVTVHSHLRMEGQWRVERAADTPRWLRRSDLRAAIGTSTWTALGLRLGLLEVLPTADEPTVVGHLGPDLLGPDWDAAVAVANLRTSDATIGAALLDQRHLAGVGTLWAAESLFLERLHPWTMAAELPEAVLATLVARVHRLIDTARHQGVQASTGVRRHGEETYVHARAGRPCRRCASTVRVAMVGPPGRERTMFYCPTCQGGLGMTDDGRPQRPLGSSGGRATPYRAR